MNRDDSLHSGKCPRRNRASSVKVGSGILEYMVDRILHFSAELRGRLHNSLACDMQ